MDILANQIKKNHGIYAGLKFDENIIKKNKIQNSSTCGWSYKCGKRTKFKMLKKLYSCSVK